MVSGVSHYWRYKSTLVAHLVIGLPAVSDDRVHRSQGSSGPLRFRSSFTAGGTSLTWWGIGRLVAGSEKDDATSAMWWIKHSSVHRLSLPAVHTRSGWFKHDLVAGSERRRGYNGHLVLHRGKGSRSLAAGTYKVM